MSEKAECAAVMLWGAEPGIKFRGKTTNGGNIVITEVLSFFGQDNAVWIDINLGVNPPTVDLHGHEPDEAGKVFWNAVASLVGRPPLFNHDGSPT